MSGSEKHADTLPKQLYQSLPLDLLKAETRLLRLTSSEGELRGRLEVASLDDKPDFTAVSYVWLEDVPTSYMVCNGIRIPITSSIRSALLQFRSIGKRTFWIDQIAIDQSNNNERTHQVNMMIKIYSTASTVLVWIGDSDQDTSKAFQLASWLGNTFYLLPAASSWFGVTPTHVEDALRSLPQDYTKWKAWLGLLDRPWFRRVWTLQEVSYCADTQVYCGKHTISYMTLWSSFVCLPLHPTIRNTVLKMTVKHIGLTNTIQGFINQQAIIDGLPLQTPVSLKMVNHLRLGSEPRPVELFSSLCMTRTRNCKRPEDKINGVLAHLASLCNIHDAPVSDATLSPAAAYIRVVRYLIPKGVGINILFQAGLQQRQEIELPSWCPDFSTSKPTPIFLEAQAAAKLKTGLSQPESLSKYAWMYDGYQKYLRIPPELPTVVHLGPTTDTISLKARIVDTIITIGPVHPGDWTDIKDLKEILGFKRWDAATTKVLSRSPAKARRYMSEVSRASAYARTIIIVDSYSENPKVKDPYVTYRNLSGLPHPQQFSQMDDFLGLNRRSALKRRVGITSRGNIGLFPACSQPGDKVCAAIGSEFPFVLRRTLRNPPLIVDGRRRWTFKFLGDSYVHDIMKDGKLIDKDMERPEVTMYLL